MAKRNELPTLTAAHLMTDEPTMTEEPRTEEHPTFSVHIIDMLGHLLNLYFETSDPSVLVTMSHVLEQAQKQRNEREALS